MAGCGGGDDTTTGGGNEDMAMQVFKVQSGSYMIKNLTKVSDACGLALENPATVPPFTSVQVTNNGQGHLSLGTMCMSSGNPPTCTPAVYSLGEGDFTSSYNVTTMATTNVSYDASGGCKADRTRTNVVTVTANNSLHIEFTEDESNITTTGCGVTFTTCQSKYTFDATM
jgi:hypothetical protein